jgi:hypothetical protein
MRVIAGETKLRRERAPDAAEIGADKGVCRPDNVPSGLRPEGA